MQPDTWISPYWLTTGLSGHFPETVTIQAGTEVQGDHGDVTTVYADMASPYDAIPAAVAQASAREAARSAVVTIAGFTAVLNGYYPLITNKHRAVWQGRTFDIIDYIHAPMQSFTRIILQEVT